MPQAFHITLSQSFVERANGQFKHYLKVQGSMASPYNILSSVLLLKNFKIWTRMALLLLKAYGSL